MDLTISGGVNVQQVVKQASRLFRVQVDGHDETVQTQHFGEDKDQDHADEQARLLGRSTDTGISDDSNSETGSQAGEADSETSSQMDEAPGGERERSINYMATIFQGNYFTYLYKVYLLGSSRAPAIRTATTRP